MPDIEQGNRGPGIMETATGLAFDLIRPATSEVTIGDIAWHLAMECRFCGAVKWHYSVAQHSIYVAREFKQRGGVNVRNALLHDAHEAYLKDIHRPLKGLIGDEYRRLVTIVQQTIEDKLGVAAIGKEYDLLKLCDNIVLRAEAERVMSSGGSGWDWSDVPSVDIPIGRWSPEESREMFVQFWVELEKRS